MNCDVHPDRDMVYYLEGEEANCYQMCSLDELEALIRDGKITGHMVPCGHKPQSDVVTWPTAIGLVPTS